MRFIIVAAVCASVFAAVPGAVAPAALHRLAQVQVEQWDSSWFGEPRDYKPRLAAVEFPMARQKYLGGPVGLVHTITQFGH
jgi:hypothetical protein